MMLARDPRFTPRWQGILFVLLSALLAAPVSFHAARADGTETLGAPSVSLAEGTGIVAAGAGLQVQPALLEVDVPPAAQVRQVLLYWSGESPVGPDDTLQVNGVPVTGVPIGGPTFFFRASGQDFDVTAYRADITDLGLVGPGPNALSLDGLEFLAPPFASGLGNHGAGLLVIFDEGTRPTQIDVRDGVDLAFCGFPEPRRSTVPQTYNFPASDADRMADLALFFGSVGGENRLRPNLIEISTGGSTISLVNVLGGHDGEFWDTQTIAVDVPAGATELTVQAISAGPAPDCASLTWVASTLALPEAARCGDGIVDASEECDDGNTEDLDGCRNDCTLPFCGDGILDAGEACDDGNPNDLDGCRNDCTVPFCGDGILDAGEACDDGNTQDGDGCSAGCRIENVCDLEVVKIATPEVVFPVPPPSCDTEGKPRSLTFVYTGDGCEAGTNPQNGKAECAGDPAGAEPIQLVVTGKDADKLVVSPSSESVAVGDAVTIERLDGRAFPANTDLEVRQAGSVLQTLRIHTSCSQPLEVGDQFGSLQLVGMNGKQGTAGEVAYEVIVTNHGDPLADVVVEDDHLGPLGTLPLLAPGEVATFSASAVVLETTTNTVTVSGTLPDGSPCQGEAQATVTVETPPASCADGKPKALVFEYTGDPCEATTNDQLGKALCSGDPAGAEPIRVVARDARKVIVAPETESIFVGDPFVVEATGSRLGADTRLEIRQGSAVLQSLSIHTSCSKELNVGDQFGSLVLREFIPDSGGSTRSAASSNGSGEEKGKKKKKD